MENKVKEIYTVLSGGKKIIAGDYIISPMHFNSITRDRFTAELHKNGIAWSGNEISFDDLLNNKNGSKTNGTTHANSVTALPKNNALTSSINNTVNNFSVGIDIQDVNELPSDVDFWEDAFYKLRFKPEEIAYCVKKEKPVESFAGMYACKEALIKCDSLIEWDDIKLSFNQIGKPVFNGYEISISHSGNFAVAIAFKLTAIKIEIPDNTEKTAQMGISQAVVSNNIETAKVKPRKYHLLAYIVMLGIIVYFIYRDYISKQ